MRIRGLVAAVFAIFLTAAGVAEAQPMHASKAQPVGQEFYGVNAQNVFSLPRDQWDVQLAAMQAAGLSVVRRDAGWGAAEPQPPDPATGAHHYVWEPFDAQVEALSRHGLRWYPGIAYSAPWAASIPGNPFSPPMNLDDYVSFARAFASRYGRGGSFWSEHPELPSYPVTSYEVWNEPNFDRFWQPQAGAADRYADLYMATRAALKQVDPDALVVVGGLVDWDRQSFIRQMYRHRPDLRGNVDAVGYHPYHVTAERVENSIRDLRRTLDSYDESNVPIEVTEVGLAASDSAEEAVRARLLSALATRLPMAGLGVTRLIPYTLVTPAGEPQWGIFNEDGTPRPSGAAYAGALQEMKTAQAHGRLARALVRARRTRVGRRNQVRVKVACRGAAGFCGGTVRLETRRRTPRRGPVVATSPRYTLTAGHTKTIMVRLTKSQRRMVRRVGRVRARVVVRPTTALLGYRSRSRAVTLLGR